MPAKPLPTMVFFTMGPRTFSLALEEPVDPSSLEMTVWVGRVKFKCYRLPWRQYLELTRRYRGHLPTGVVTGFALAPGHREIHLWPVPDRRTEVALNYGPMLKLVS